VARIRDVVLDSSHPASIARFWAEARHDGWATLADPEGNEFDVMRD
jgi:hypothetical protein